MRKYSICFLLLLTAAALGFALGLGLTRGRMRYETAIPDTIFETEAAEDYRIVIHQDDAEPVSATTPQERYCLVSEAGFLFVKTEGEPGGGLQTHIPVTDFPTGEQRHLQEGIWFDSMMEVFFYLESYTS